MKKYGESFPALSLWLPLLFVFACVFAALSRISLASPSFSPRSLRSTMAHLDQGSIAKIANNEDAGKPLVQIISIKLIQSGTDGAQERYRFVDCSIA